MHISEGLGLGWGRVLVVVSGIGSGFRRARSNIYKPTESRGVFRFVPFLHYMFKSKCTPAFSKVDCPGLGWTGTAGPPMTPGFCC